jgi:RNA-binding protein Musashi
MDATVMFDRETSRSKGFAFATFGNEESVGVAMAASGIELEGKAVSCTVLFRWECGIRAFYQRSSKLRGVALVLFLELNFQIEIKKAQPRGSGNLPNKFTGNASQPGRAGGAMNMMGGAPMMGLGGGMGMGMGMGNMSTAAFDPSAMMMMYQNMMKTSGMGTFSFRV